MSTSASDEQLMHRAIELAALLATRTSPNPWVGCVIETPDGDRLRGRHRAAGRPARRGRRPRGGRRGTLAAPRSPSTLEPCSHHGRTPPCADAHHRGRRRPGRRRHRGSRPAGAGRGHRPAARRGRSRSPPARAPTRSRAQLAPYLNHRRTGRPYVVLKLAATLDGRTAAPDGTSQWITGRRGRGRRPPAAGRERRGRRRRRHGPGRRPVAHRRATPQGRDPLRVVLGHAPDRRQGPSLPRDARRPRRRARRARRQGHPPGAGRGRRHRRRPRSTAPASSTATSLYLAPALFGGDDARAAVRRAGRADHRRRLARPPDLGRSPRRRPRSISTLEPA